MQELLTPNEMGRADQSAIENGPLSGLQLMRNAGSAVVREIMRRFPDAVDIHILCGPGNNGGDGYVIANLLHKTGLPVFLHALAPPKPGTDADLALAECGVDVRSIGELALNRSSLVVDALFGAGLERPLSGAALEVVEKVEAAGCRVTAVDLPSGLSGESGKVLGGACTADLTVTFFRKKPGHLLYPGRALCGELILADIGIRDEVLDEISPSCFENGPASWASQLPSPGADAHKYSRGAVGVFSGGPTATGAARLSAMAAQRAGAGAVTVYSPASALAVNAGHLTSIMLSKIDTPDELAAMLHDTRISSFVLGPGFGVGLKSRDFVRVLVGTDPDRKVDNLPRSVVLDADALTSFEADPTALFDRNAAENGPALVLTPHEGEFKRLFSDLASDGTMSKLDRARAAAELAQATVVYKGPDTVIAAADGRAAINTNATARLATAGSGDVLAGIIAGLLAQGMPEFEAACAGVWLHGETGRIAGQGAIAEDLVLNVGEAIANLG